MEKESMIEEFGRGKKPPEHRERNRGRQTQLSGEQREKIVELHLKNFGTRKIADKTGVGRKVVRNLLKELGYLEQQSGPPAVEGAPRASKLDPFRELIQEKVKKQLTVTRILREIRECGYTGGRTILADYVRTIRIPPVPRKQVWRRFETRIGEDYVE